MRLVLENENRIRLEMTGDAFEITSEGPAISPFHLLAGSLASCTALTVASWAQGLKISVEPLVISVSWELAEDRPKRVTTMDMELRWPGLPNERVATAERVADLCPIHTTLKRATDISRRIVAG
jgi:putative redox protein